MSVEIIDHWQMGCRPAYVCPDCGGAAAGCTYWTAELGYHVQRECTSCSWIWSSASLVVRVTEDMIPSQEEQVLPERVPTTLFTPSEIKPAAAAFDYEAYNKLRHRGMTIQAKRDRLHVG